jgi:hypothetical protein
MKSKATVMTAKATRAKPLDEQLRRDLQGFYNKVRDESVKETQKAIQDRQRNAMRVRHKAFK